MILFHIFSTLLLLDIIRDYFGIRNFGLRVKQLRLAKRLSQEALAFEANIEIVQLSRIERGVINTSISQAFNLANALNLNVMELFNFSEL
jgi:transcriptional regulator with XRE-family HTH domain